VSGNQGVCKLGEHVRLQAARNTKAYHKRFFYPRSTAKQNILSKSYKKTIYNQWANMMTTCAFFYWQKSHASRLCIPWADR